MNFNFYFKFLFKGIPWTEPGDFEENPSSILREEDEDSGNAELPPFRGRAQTDGHLLSR